MKVVTLILAAGHGTRMKSAVPKVIHPVCGRPLVFYPTRAAFELGSDEVVLVVNPTTAEPIESALSPHLAHAFVGGQLPKTAIQEVPRGTGDAVRAGLSGLELAEDDLVVILSGDVPLLTAGDLIPLVEGVRAGATLAFLSFEADDPTGYGRVLRDARGSVTEIREHRDLATDAERAVREVNAGVYAARAGALRAALASLKPQNAQGELYLTDVVGWIAKERGVGQAVAISSPPELACGVNDRAQLAEVEAVLFARLRRQWARAGVTIVGCPLIDDAVLLSPDVRLEDGVRIRGRSSVGRGTKIDVGNVIEDTAIGEDAVLKPYCVASNSVIGDGVQLGPFAHLRPGSVLEGGVHIGNFVETKNTLVKKGAKANHLTYLGDAEVGEGSNVGAGTIVCNYDGFQKQRTVIGARVFIGSDSQLIAPVVIGDDAYVATATTVHQDVPPGALAIGRSRQQNKEGYAAMLRERLSETAREAKRRKDG